MENNQTGCTMKKRGESTAPNRENLVQSDAVIRAMKNPGESTAPNRKNLAQTDAVNRENADVYSEEAVEPNVRQNGIVFPDEDEVKELSIQEY
jgi:hypothetical protein